MQGDTDCESDFSENELQSLLNFDIKLKFWIKMSTVI